MLSTQRQGLETSDVANCYSRELSVGLQDPLAGVQPAPDQDNCSTVTAVIATEELIQRAYQSFEKLLATLYEEAPSFSAETVSAHGEFLLV